MHDNNYWMWNNDQRRLPRRSLLRSAGLTSVGLSAAALLACSGNGGNNTNKPATKPATTGGAAATAAPGGAGTPASGAVYTQPTGGWDKMTAAQFLTNYDGDNFRNLATQKDGPKPGFRARYAGGVPVSWSPLQPSSAAIPGAAFAHNQLLQIRSDDFMKTVHYPETWPVLAEAAPEQPDAMTYTFKLVKGVKFQNVTPVNGREMTADDIKYCFDVYRQSPAQSPALAAVKSVDVIDKYTVQFKMNEPFGPFLQTISAPMFWIFSKEQHTSTDKSLDMNLRPIGTGAFIFKKAEPNVGYSFDKNPDYFRKDPRTGAQLPYLDGLDVTQYQDVSSQTSAYRAGEIDYLGNGAVNTKLFVEVMKSNPKSIGEFTVQGVGQLHFGMRQDKPPFNDVRLRQALSMLIDRDSIIKNILFGNGIYASGEMWSYWGLKAGFPTDRLGKNYQYNKAEAMKLLQAGGYDKGLTIPMNFGTYTNGPRFDAWAAATAMWEAAGIKVNITSNPDFAAFAKTVFSDRSVEGMFAWADVPPGIDPDIYSYQILKSGEPNNIYYVSDPKIDKLCVDQRRALDAQERRKILDELLDYSLDQMTRIELVVPDKINIRVPNVFNITDNSEFWSIFGWGPMASDVVWKSSDRPA